MFCFGAHPLQVLDSFAQGNAQVGDQFDHPVFGFLWEVGFYVELAEGFTQSATGYAQYPFPAWTHYFGACHGFAIEVKAGFHEVGGEVRGSFVDDVPFEIDLPVFHRDSGQQGTDLLHEDGLVQVDGTGISDADLREVFVPVEGRREFDQLFCRHLVVGLVGIAAFQAGHRSLGKFCLEGHNLPGIRGSGCFVTANQLEHGGDVSHIFDAKVGRSGILIYIIVAVGHSHTRLGKLCDDHRAVAGISRAIEAEEGGDAVLVHLGDGLLYSIDRGDSVDLLQVGQNVVGSLFFDFGGIHP